MWLCMQTNSKSRKWTMNNGNAVKRVNANVFCFHIHTYHVGDYNVVGSSLKIGYLH